MGFYVVILEGGVGTNVPLLVWWEINDNGLYFI